MTRNRPISPPIVTATRSSLWAEASRGARAGFAVGVYVLCGAMILTRLNGYALPTVSWGMFARVLVGLVSVATGTAIARAGWTRVRSVFGAMCVGILAVTAAWVGVLASVPGGVPLLVMRFIWPGFPIGAILGFIDWNDLYRNVRPGSIPPRA